MCTLSILVPTYKRSIALRRNLQSIVSAGLKPIEVIVGDDGGDEDTAKVCNEYERFLPLIRLVPAGKGSLSTNLTRLFNAANGKWILLLHDDDFLVGDHSKFPMCLDNDYELFFTDHWIAYENGEIDKKNSYENSKSFRRDFLSDGLQKNNIDIGINQSICLDGFYIRKSALLGISPDKDLGQVADYFWMLKILSQPIRIGYSSARTFSYVISKDGLTGTGGRLNEDSIKGYKKAICDIKDEKLMTIFKEKISFNTWYGVNSCLKRGDRRAAYLLLKDIDFRYNHSVKHQIFMIVQLILILIPFKILK
jgi:glycosyltransferase involved in cell wall biosynthesis